MAAESGHRVRRFVEIGADQIAPVFRIQSRRKTSRADKIAEHDRDRAALGLGMCWTVGLVETSRPAPS
jgi:hypothetical protein